MKPIFTLLFVAFIATMISCEKEKDIKDENSAQVVLKSSSADFLEAKSDISSETSDPFELGDVVINGNQVSVTVSYSGGCKPHTFEIIWDEVVASTNPPQINLIILHDSNDDNCEAYITETLVFELEELVGTASVSGSAVGAYSGYDDSDSAVYEGNEVEFNFVESDVCNLNVVAGNAICGWGLYGSTWFALSDSISAGTPDFYFKKYLQPVSVVSSLADFRPVVGKKYSIGARYDYSTVLNPSQPVCLAYPGPSVPVKIMCIAEIE